MEVHNHHDIFYIVTATIELHNMMVKVYMGQGESESSKFYITEELLSSEAGAVSNLTW